MFNRNSGYRDSAAKICEILYDRSTSGSTVQNWQTHFKKDTFKANDFPGDKHKILNGQLSEFTKSALVVYDHGHKLTAEEARERINNLFGNGAVTLDFVQVIFTKLILCISEHL
jgi:hypothetical protein